MFGYHPAINTISGSTAPDLTKELEKIEVKFGEFSIVFEEELLSGFEGDWSFKIINHATGEETYKGVEKDELTNQINILHALKNKNISGLLAVFKDEYGISARAIRKVISHALDQRNTEEHQPSCEMIETPKRLDPLANENLDAEALRIKKLLGGAGFPSKGFTLQMHGKIINGQYYSKGLFLVPSQGEKIAMRMRNEDMAKVINLLKNIAVNETFNTYHVLELAHFIASKNYDGRRIKDALINGHIKPEVKSAPEHPMLRLRP